MHFTRRAGALTVGVIGALLFAGCAAPLPTAAPDPTPAIAPPVLDDAQEAAVLEAVGATIQEADAARNPDLLPPRVFGPALAMRTSQLKVAAVLGKDDLVKAVPTEVQATVVPTTQTWPRTSYAVSVQPEDLTTPRLVALEQTGPREQYRMWAWVRLFPGLKLPSFADPSIGSEAVAPDDDSLLATPTDALAQYADVLTLGDASAYAATFEGDSFRSGPLADRTNLWATALQAPGVEGTRTMTFSPMADETVRSVRTSDDGAMVVGAMTSEEIIQAKEGAQVPPTNESERAFVGDAAAVNTLHMSWLTTVALEVPPAGSDRPIRVLGVEHVLTNVTY